ncbi:hypothetical protein [Enterococcus wangshanyuanii]|uniref:Phage protein n=1 Tax=Enterococcus wangshanyuanii TaxID=2005703 RepID=A0ABQ1PV95_9ENTE|nr:hypothetical protein [Enterococcus wangshanyuanii]GGD04373.1 hypothetical protein GCM10011573_37390 [Enterococcus wangshanyuanii]
MVKNKLIDLNNHLFEQLERLNDDGLTGEQLDEEIKRAQAMKGIAGQIINNANTAIRAKEVFSEHRIEKDIPEMLE